jgi:uncharacterized repeat protein (TIGR01451 family)
VTLTDSPDPVPSGQNVTLTVSISNGGPQTATGVSATVTLPASFTFQSSTCTGTQARPSCSGLTLTNGQSVQYQVVAKTSSTGPATTSVSVTSSVTDPTPGNNSASQQTTVGAPVVCSPRPRIGVSTLVVSGRLQVTLSTNIAGNTVQSVRFGTNTRSPVHALVDLPDGRTGLSGAMTVQPNPGSASYTFWIRRDAAGQPTTVPLIVTNACGTWETFVGGGTGAGF